MYSKLAAALTLVALLGGCSRRDTDTGAANDHSGTDTVVRSSTVRDTMVVKKDTSIDVDTVKKTDHIKKDS